LLYSIPSKIGPILFFIKSNKYTTKAQDDRHLILGTCPVKDPDLIIGERPIMARIATKEALPQLATLPERVSVLETKVDNIDEKVGDLKVDVKEMHDCLDRTRDQLDAKLECMLDEYRSSRSNFYEHANKLHAEGTAQHNELAGKLNELEKQKHKFTLYIMMGLAFAAGAGWIGHVDVKTLLRFVGL